VGGQDNFHFLTNYGIANVIALDDKKRLLLGAGPMESLGSEISPFVPIVDVNPTNSF